MSRPCSGSDKVSIHVCVVDADILELSASRRHLGLHAVVGGTYAPLRNTRGRRNLQPMANRHNRFARIREVAN